MAIFLQNDTLDQVWNRRRSRLQEFSPSLLIHVLKSCPQNRTTAIFFQKPAPRFEIEGDTNLRSSVFLSVSVFLMYGKRPTVLMNSGFQPTGIYAITFKLMFQV